MIENARKCSGTKRGNEMKSKMLVVSFILSSLVVSTAFAGPYSNQDAMGRPSANISSIKDEPGGDLPLGSLCGLHMASLNSDRANELCQGRNPRYGCPAKFTQRTLGYFEAGGGRRAWMTCVKTSA